MKYLTRQEELVLLSVFQLKENAYLITIQNFLNRLTGKKWSISSVYVPLSRLEKNGYLKSTIGEATEKRGGKGIKYYQITKAGTKALSDLKDVYDKMWKGIGELVIKEQKG
jgi:DNA-binding PadR family transcriptional regulator